MPEELHTICLRLTRRYFSSALEFSRLPLDELRLWIDAAVKESRERRTGVKKTAAPRVEERLGAKPSSIY